jgi:hypothetical protein
MRVVLLLAFVAACAAHKPACPIAQPAPAGPPFLWKAYKTGAPVWLYGTIHDAGPSRSSPEPFHARGLGQ